MTNTQKIKELEKELGRWKKHCDDLCEIGKRQAEQVDRAKVLSAAIDAILTQTALTYGEDAVDPDTGKIIGKRLTLPEVDIKALREKYEVHARKDGVTKEYIIGVGLRDDPDDHGGKEN